MGVIMNAIDRIKKTIEQLELIYDVSVIYKLRLQFENCLNCHWYHEDLKATLFCEDFGLNSDELIDIRDFQFMLLDYFGGYYENQN